jgi:DNA-directed RNA polymerase specialized sigma24 family protein
MEFRELVKRHNRAMKRIALTFVRSASVADEVVQETWLALVAAAIEQLPERQEQVIGLRDVEGCEAEDVCESLELSPANQRLLLHRADPRGLLGIRRGRVVSAAGFAEQESGDRACGCGVWVEGWVAAIV